MSPSATSTTSPGTSSAATPEVAPTHHGASERGQRGDGLYGINGTPLLDDADRGVDGDGGNVVLGEAAGRIDRQRSYGDRPVARERVGHGAVEGLGRQCRHRVTLVGDIAILPLGVPNRPVRGGAQRGRA